MQAPRYLAGESAEIDHLTSLVASSSMHDAAPSHPVAHPALPAKLPRLGGPPRRVVVLLDGDGDAFHMQYLKDGFLGGTRAAIELHKQVRALVCREEGGTVPVQAMVLLFLNSSGFENYRRAVGVDFNLGAFMQGFSTSPFPAAMVDTGFKPQSADRALETMLTFHLPVCDYLFLGGSHDGGYSNLLHRLDADGQDMDKIRLFCTTTYVAQPLLDINLKQVRPELGLFDGRDPRKKLTKETSKPATRPRSKSPTKSAPSIATFATVEPAHVVVKPVKSSVTVAEPAGFKVTPSKPLSAKLSRALSNPTPAKPSDALPSVSIPNPGFATTDSIWPIALSPRKTTPPPPARDAFTAKDAPSFVGVPLHLIPPQVSPPRNIAPSPVAMALLPASLLSTSPGSSSNTFPSTDDSDAPTPSTSKEAKSVAFKKSASGTTPGSLAPNDPSRFMPLLTVLHDLRAQGLRRPLRSVVGGKLSAIPSATRGVGFTKLATEAEAAGLVRLGDGGKIGREWIELANPTQQVEDASSSSESEWVSDSAMDASPTTTPSAITVPAQYRRLVHCVKYLCDQFGRVKVVSASVDATLRKLNANGSLDPTVSPAVSFEAYIGPAVASGIVVTGSANGIKWIALPSGH